MASYDKAYELASELKASEEYKEYQKVKAEVASSQEALSILRDYRRAEIAFQTALLSGQQPDDRQKEEFETISSIVNMHGPIKRYIEAERRMLVILADIQRILTEAMNLLEL
ncbi:MAG: YlbF family regulator [Bacillota bacterium]